MLGQWVARSSSACQVPSCSARGGSHRLYYLSDCTPQGCNDVHSKKVGELPSRTCSADCPRNPDCPMHVFWIEDCRELLYDVLDIDSQRTRTLRRRAAGHRGLNNCDERVRPQKSKIGGCIRSGSLAIAAPAASYVNGFSQPRTKLSASACARHFLR